MRRGSDSAEKGGNVVAQCGPDGVVLWAMDADNDARVPGARREEAVADVEE